MFKVYYTLRGNAYAIDVMTLKEALTTSEALRKSEGVCYVTMVCENPNSVGKPGVDEIKNGLTPDGHEYGWIKRRELF